MIQTGDIEAMPHPGEKLHIRLKPDDAVRGLLKVKPTADMPRPGTAKKKITKGKEVS